MNVSTVDIGFRQGGRWFLSSFGGPWICCCRCGCAVSRDDDSSHLFCCSHHLLDPVIRLLACSALCALALMHLEALSVTGCRDDEPAVRGSSVEKADPRARRNPAAKNEFSSAMEYDGNDLNRTASSTEARHTNAVRANSHGETDFSIQVDCRQLGLVASLMTV